MTIQEQWTTDHDDDIITELTFEEFQAAALAALERLGLTYAELREQARNRNFSSAEAHSLWVTIGGTLDL
ncbi:hypothetical protein ACIQNU_04150 [Streptomyces sp. NPDC091292]|uniref:hypothetical protein n=1 Tax=Streptomyces sp. NPDC091292 TaxID=3365991 RepID=UPI0037F28356